MTIDIRRRDTLRLLAAAGMLPAVGRAQPAYPDRPVTIIVPYTAGGGVDTIIRLLSQPLGERLGQTIVVDNRAGVSGIVGAQVVSRARPDGYMLLAGNTTVNSINPLLMKNPGYQPQKDFAPIALLGTFPTVLVVPTDSPFRDVKDLIAKLRAAPAGKYSYGSSGIGSAHFLAAQLFQSATGTQMLHVPYKGSPQVMTDLMGGQIDMAFEVAQVAGPLVKSGRLRALGVTGLQPIPLLPEVKPIAELGLPGFEMQTWHAMYAPAGTPPDIVARLARDTSAVVKLPDISKRMIEMGVLPDGRTGPELVKFLNDDSARWTKVIHDAGIEPQ
ncbi:tripartite tricarboxylate transporter substrate binding protein [Pigmentiphaga soli]|uniref:Tripartite tricarboxylate transporter substrate binding protein n=1 Tax=Pigmentiphaga soli TaxID=1007095 RepID=A0ABP8HJN0_9BURK